MAIRRLIRTIRSLVVLLIVLAVLGAVAIVLLPGRAAKKAVETSGTNALKVAVTVGQGKASVFSGTVGLYEITVANPAGYQGPALLKLQQADLRGNMGSLLSNEVLIQDMKLDNMEIFIEQKGLENNLYQVIKPLRGRKESTGKGLVIDNLEVKNVTVHVGLGVLPGQPSSVDLKLASIQMAGLGRNEKMDTAALIAKILLAVAEGIAQQGGNILPKETVGELGSILDKAIDIGKIILGPGGKTPDGQPKDSLGKTITDGLKDLLGGKKKQESP